MFLASIVAILVAASACGGRPAPGPVAGIGKEEGAPVDSAAKNQARPPAASPSKKPVPAGTSASEAGTQAVASSPQPFKKPFPADPAVLVDATLTPICADNGTRMTLVVKTNPDAGVGYQAIYSNGSGGGPPPYGRGYGGNGHGLADSSGRFTSTWVISESAPAGEARVDVVVGWGGKYGYDSLTFHVGPQAKCS